MTVPWLVLVFVAVLGLAVGTFLTTVVHRVPREQALLSPPAYCPHCEQPIKPWHNVPLASYTVLRGRCANCHEPIGLRYPVVEAITAALFVGLALRFGLSAELPAYLYLAAVAVALATIDVDVQRVPDSIVLPSYAVGVLLLMPAGAVDGDWWPALRALIGMLVLWTVYFGLALAYPNSVGFGEVKLAGLLGLYLGWLSWSTVVIGLSAGFLLAGLSAGLLIAVGPRTPLPGVLFGPPMIAGAFVAIFTAETLTSW